MNNLVGALGIFALACFGAACDSGGGGGGGGGNGVDAGPNEEEPECGTHGTDPCPTELAFLATCKHKSTEEPDPNCVALETEMDGSYSTVTRTQSSIAVEAELPSLPPGEIYTAWFAVFNNPEACETTPCKDSDRLTAAVEADFFYIDGWLQREGVGHRFIGMQNTWEGRTDLARGDRLDDGPGLTKPMAAEVHIIIRTHGAPVEDFELRQDQYTTFGGGGATIEVYTTHVRAHQSVDGF